MSGENIAIYQTSFLRVTLWKAGMQILYLFHNIPMISTKNIIWAPIYTQWYVAHRCCIDWRPRFSAKSLVPQHLAFGKWPTTVSRPRCNIWHVPEAAKAANVTSTFIMQIIWSDFTTIMVYYWNCSKNSVSFLRSWRTTDSFLACLGGVHVTVFNDVYIYIYIYTIYIYVGLVNIGAGNGLVDRANL